jgi:phosphoribosylformylglycinamidine synthase
MRCGVVVFPGSNCDHDVYHVLKHVLGQEVLFLWHAGRSLRDCELIVLPGGFSYGDYLRPGAIAARSPIMSAVRRHAEAGGLVLGIGNGFQILLEAGILPGAIRRHRGRWLETREVGLKVERSDLPFTAGYAEGQVLRMPIACEAGCYADTPAALDALEEAGGVVFRYLEAEDGGGATGAPAEDRLPGRSTRGIAGIVNQDGNVLGMMPHPERCAEEILNNVAGRPLLATAVGREPGFLAGDLP